MALISPALWAGESVEWHEDELPLELADRAPINPTDAASD
jgi:hypothetical protein